MGSLYSLKIEGFVTQIVLQSLPVTAESLPRNPQCCTQWKSIFLQLGMGGVLAPLLGLKHVLFCGSSAAGTQTRATTSTLPDPVQNAEPQHQ